MLRASRHQKVRDAIQNGMIEMFEGKKIAVFDLEIKEPIEECSRGWDSFDEMGVSVLVLFDYREMRYRVFADENILEALNILNQYDLVVGFNTVKFDWKVLNATYHYEKSRASKDFDILREIWLSLGLNPDVFNPATHGGYSLDNVAYETIGLRKSGNGAYAPYLYQQGKWAELIDYCLQDVKIEKELFEFIVSNGYIIRYQNRLPVEFHLDH